MKTHGGATLRFGLNVNEDTKIEFKEHSRKAILFWIVVNFSIFGNSLIRCYELKIHVLLLC
ncbi:hypothetical protein, partial [uncultured Planktosalinus sp.]|uniref:hypothetical protein n=1 Tax=uncultured Planktosalinus sp. TaxID=1810935 RepID=UPI0030DB6BE1